MRVPDQYAIQPGAQSLLASEPAASSINQSTDSEEQVMLDTWTLQMQQIQATVASSLDSPAPIARTDSAANFDRVQIHNSTGRHLAIRGSNLASAAHGLLSLQKNYNWNASSPVSVVAMLNQPKFGKLIQEGQNKFTYEPERLGTEYLRFIVQNTEGRKMIVTWRIDVRADLETGQANPEQNLQNAEYQTLADYKNNLAAWQRSANLSALIASAQQTLAGFTDLPSTALGQTTGKGTSAQITLDQNAGGHGWYIDPTPLDSSDDYLLTSNSEVWQAKAGSAAAGKMDLLSVLLHEYGHALGLEHSKDSRKTIGV